MNNDTKSLIRQAESIKNAHLSLKQYSINVQADQSIVEFYTDVVICLEELILTVSQKDYKVNYLDQLSSEVYLMGILEKINEDLISDQILDILNSNKVQAEAGFQGLKFKFRFFKTLDFFNNNVVIIGANGSGKTRISRKFIELMQNSGVVISAQKFLLIPSFTSINSQISTLHDLKQIQIGDPINKSTDRFFKLQTEFEIVLKNLLADNHALSNEYRLKVMDLVNKGEKIPSPQKSNLEKTFEIWNSLIINRHISCLDGMNITVMTDNGSSYPADQMSDGEKVILFFVSQILQAPINGFIIVDEPEMYLHKTILQKLWDRLENQRQDCIFIYLTHDLDFAAGRTTAKKIWLKSYVHPDKWDMESLPENDLPAPLLMELLGSRKNILFCEGDKGKIDDKIYNILFPNYTITPVCGCLEVINHTKAFNKIPNTGLKALGLIDSDHHPSERLSKLKSQSIYHFQVAEIENLLLDEEFLAKLASNLMVDPGIIENIKIDVINKLDQDKKTQASNFVSSRVDYYFKDSNIIKGNSIEDLQKNFENFTNEINIKEFYEKRHNDLTEIVKSKDYSKAISVYNNKGIKKCINHHFKITDFTDRAIKLLQSDRTTHPAILKYFPKELVADPN